MGELALSGRRHHAKKGRNVTTENPELLSVVLYSLPNCTHCTQAKALLNERGVSFSEILVDPQTPEGEARRDELARRSPMRTFPQIFFRDTLIGGFQELKSLELKDGLHSLRMLK